MTKRGFILSSIIASGISVSAQASDDMFRTDFLRLSSCNAWVQHCVDDSTSHDDSANLRGKIKAKDVLRLVLDALAPSEARITYLTKTPNSLTPRSEGRWEIKLGISYDGTQLMLRQEAGYAGLSLRGVSPDIDDSEPFTQIRFEIRW
jgi:hypothetical protein